MATLIFVPLVLILIGAFAFSMERGFKYIRAARRALQDKAKGIVVLRKEVGDNLHKAARWINVSGLIILLLILFSVFYFWPAITGNK